MKTIARILSAAFIFYVCVGRALAQGTAFTYQGQLSSASGPVNGLYDFQFGVYDSAGGGTQIGGTVVTNGVGVTNGLFTITLDFGANVFTGNARWLNLAAHTNQSPNAFVSMTPRQSLTPAPYAVLAGGLSPSAQINIAGLTVQQNADGAPNIIGGSPVNFVSGGVVGATIGGGGATNYLGAPVTNSVIANFGTVGGGRGNVVSNSDATVGGGDGNIAAGTYATVGGGLQNFAIGGVSTISGGYFNTASAGYGTIGGGFNNIVSNSFATVPGGYKNVAGGQYSFAGGYQAQATNDGTFVWSDSQSPNPFSSTANNQFLIRAQNGVGINTNNASGAALNVNGAVTATSFSGNGAVAWQAVKGSGAIQSQPNHGYILLNAAPTTVVLPLNANVGDIVRISGGASTWTIAQNAGQTIVSQSFGATLTERGWFVPDGQGGSTLQPEIWSGIAASSDGTKLVAVANNGPILTSTDSGVTWTQRSSAPITNWNCVASSADGTKLVAAGGSPQFSSQIYLSSDSGVTWTANSSAPAAIWNCVASSADGTKLFASDGNQIYSSIDSGVTWNPNPNSPSGVGNISCSADGSILLCGAYVANLSQGALFKSSDSGVTWTKLQNAPAVKRWTGVAISADGTKATAVAHGDNLNLGHYIYTSQDSGNTWLDNVNDVTVPPDTTGWDGVAMSADGLTIVVVRDGSANYYDPQTIISTDGGKSWQTFMTVAHCAACGGNDSTIVVGQFHGSEGTDVGALETLDTTTTVGTSGYLTGFHFSSIELQYFGSGVFVPISYAGSISRH